jgi:hypothetical protein
MPRGNLAGEGAADLGVHVLGAKADSRPVEGLRDRLDRGKRRADHNVDIGLAADGTDDFSDQRDCVGARLVHLPITGDEFSAG